MRHLILSALLLISSSMVFGQHFIKGKVTDTNGDAIHGATVYLKELSSGKTTNKKGEFDFTGLAKKNYTLSISFLGYESTEIQTITDKNLEIKLTSKSFTLDEVTVNSLRANNRTAISYSNLAKTEINQLNQGQDIPYLLALTPSFITTSDAGTGIGYTGFRIRGTDANRTNITVNGVPINDAESHGTFFVNMPDFASSLSSVQVQRGVGTSTHGAGAFGASINMQTEGLITNPYGEISTTLGSFNTNKNTLKVGSGLLDNGFAFDARLSNVKSDGYIDRSWVNMKSYYFSVAYFAENTSVKFLTFGGNEKTSQAWYGVDSELMKTNRTYNDLGEYTDNKGDKQYYNNQTDNYNQTHYQLHWVQVLNSKINLSTTAHLTRGLGFYEEYKTERKYSEYGLTPDTLAGKAMKTTDLVRQKWLDNYFYGFTFALNYETTKTKAVLGGAINRYDGNHFGKVIWVRNANNLDMSKEWYRSKGIKEDANIYAKINTELLENLIGTVDLQYRHINYRMSGTDDKYDSDSKKMRNITTSNPYVYNFFNPKIGLTYNLDNQQNIYASYSISNREPNRNNYTESGVNDKPTFETLYDIESGYRFQSEKISTSANVYFMNYRNQLILTGKISEIGELLTSNIPDSYRLGIELSVNSKITNWLNWGANLNLSRNKILNFTEQDVDMYDADWNWIDSKSTDLGTTDIAYSPNIVANNIFTINLKKYEIGLYSNFVGRQFIDNTSNKDRSIDPYFVNNISMKYTFSVPKTKGIELKLLANNIFNNKYETNGYNWYTYYLDGKRINEKRYFPQAGINLLATVTLKF